MRICIVNNSRISDLVVLQAIRAINAQLVDFAYHWSVLAQLRLEGSRSNVVSMKELRGDGIIYLQRTPDVDALGWHDADVYGVPHGVVYTEVNYDEPWTVTLSHEVLELLLDPHANRLAAGPHPVEKRLVMHWYEACDAVQACTYQCAGVEVSDFLLPAYFTMGEERGMRMSYLGQNIKSFGVAPGGYVGFYDPLKNTHDTHFADAKAKSMFNTLGRTGRYLRLCSQISDSFGTAKQAIVKDPPQ